MINVYEILLLLELINAILISVLVLTGKVRGDELRIVHRVAAENNRIIKKVSNTVNSNETSGDIQGKKID